VGGWDWAVGGEVRWEEITSERGRKVRVRGKVEIKGGIVHGRKGKVEREGR